MNVGPQMKTNLKLVGFSRVEKFTITETLEVLTHLGISSWTKIEICKMYLSSSHIFEINTRILNIVSSIFDTIKQEE